MKAVTTLDHSSCIKVVAVILFPRVVNTIPVIAHTTILIESKLELVLGDTAVFKGTSWMDASFGPPAFKMVIILIFIESE